MRREREKSQPAIEVDDIKKIFGMLESPITHNSHELLSDVHCQQKRGFFYQQQAFVMKSLRVLVFLKRWQKLQQLLMVEHFRDVAINNALSLIFLEIFSLSQKCF